MRQKITNNFTLKMISLLLALVLWMVVTNVENPEQTKTLDLPVTRVNEEMIRENDKTYEVIEGNSVTITVRARQSVLRNLSPDDFEATADFSNLTFTGAIPIQITPLHYSGQVSIINGNNAVMKVVIEELASVNKMVTSRCEGSVISSKALESITVEPDMIRIEGAKTTIDSIGSVYAVVNISDLDEDTVFTVSPTIYDTSGNVLDSTDLSFSDEKLKVSVKLQETKVVPVKWQINANAAEGYGIQSMDYSPKEVSIAGSAADLKNIGEIVLEDYNVDELTENYEITQDLEQIVTDMGFALVKPDTEDTVKAVIKVAPYERISGTLPFESVHLKGASDQYKYSLADEDAISYTLYGVNSEIVTLDKAQLKFSADVSGLTEGLAMITLELETSQKVQLADEVDVLIRIEAK